MRTVISLLLMLVVTAAASAAVFQYNVPLESEKGSHSAFLWIPPEAKQVRGVILAGSTLMERPFSKDPIIRKAAAEEQLAIVFSTKGLGGLDIQKLLDKLAEESGYKEVSVAPLMFVGHSAGGPPSHDLARKYADRSFGLVQYRGGGPSKDFPVDVPALMMVGQFDEFGGRMDRPDGTEQWDGGRKHMAGYRKENPQAAATVIVEPGAGHFAWSERNAKYLAMWIQKAAEARIPEKWNIDADKPVNLKEIDYDNGYLTSLALEKKDPTEAAGVDEYKGDKSYTNWHFDKEMAEATERYHDGLARKKHQFIKWKDAHWVDAGARFFFLGMKWVDDGTVFEVHPVYRDDIPGQYKDRGPKWINAGQKVGHSDAPIKVRPVSGPIVAIGDNRLRLQHDSLNPAGARSRATFIAYSEGDEEYRYTEQVGMMPRGWRGLKKGKSQTITFPELKDIPADSKPVDLEATSDARLPVRYYVAYGPAVVENGKLKVTQVPRRAECPIEVKVVAYQFGSGLKGKQIKTAEPVERTLKITKP